jgi:hypothetical protein
MNIIFKAFKKTCGFLKKIHLSHTENGMLAYAMQGSPINQIQLAEFLLEMKPPKLIQAYAWATVAAYQNVNGANKLINLIAENLTQTELNEAQALGREYKLNYSRK